MRGEVFRLREPRGSRGREQSGLRYAVVVQSDALPLSTWLVAPTSTSTSARPASFRPEIELAGDMTRVLVEQTAAVDPRPPRRLRGILGAPRVQAVDAALRTVLGL